MMQNWRDFSLMRVSFLVEFSACNIVWQTLVRVYVDVLRTSSHIHVPSTFQRPLFVYRQGVEGHDGQLKGAAAEKHVTQVALEHNSYRAHSVGIVLHYNGLDEQEVPGGNPDGRSFPVRVPVRGGCVWLVCVCGGGWLVGKGVVSGGGGG